MATLLTREAILAAHDLKTQDVDVPEWGGTVRVRELTADERDALEVSMIAERGAGQLALDKDLMAGMRARLCSMSIVDEQGNLVFTQEDVAALGKKSSAALQRVYNASMELSAFTEKDVEELVGNSGGAPSASSDSDSPSPSA